MRDEDDLNRSISKYVYETHSISSFCVLLVEHGQMCQDLLLHLMA